MLPPVRRIVPRFRLRTLLVAVAIIGAACAWLAARLASAKREHDAVVALLRADVLVDYDYSLDSDGRSARAEPSAPKWLRSVLGDEFFNHVVNLYAGPSDDGALKYVKDLPSLRRLSIQGGDLGFAHDINDSSMASLSDLSALKHLTEVIIGGRSITDRGLAHLDGLPYVEKLTLGDTGSTGNGLRFLPAPERLAELVISGPAINDEGLAVLDRFRCLKSLDLTIDDVGISTMRRIGNLKDLRALTIASPGLIDDELGPLTGLSDLRLLELKQCPVTDEGIKQLSPLKQLSRLTFRNTKVTPAGEKSLRKLMPDTVIIREADE